MNLITAEYLPFLVNFLILKVALPALFVLAVKVLPLTLMVTLTLLIALPDLDFKAIVYFLVLVLALKVFFLAVILDASLVIFTVAVLLFTKPIMHIFTNEMDVINAYVRELKLATFRENAEPYAQDAVREQWGCLGYLRRLLEEEVTRRREKSKITRIHKAGFPQMKYLEELERNELPVEGQAMLPVLETLDFINEGRSAVMYGNPGTGKTHMAIALGVKACLEGYSVFFTSIPRLLTQIREAKTDRTLRNLEVKFERFDLVICDELGYVGFDKEGAEMLFNHLSLRTGKKATIITTNLPFTRWEEVLKDKVLCAALVDRLCHKSYLINMTGTSYRIKETKKINQKNIMYKQLLISLQIEDKMVYF